MLLPKRAGKISYSGSSMDKEQNPIPPVEDLTAREVRKSGQLLGSTSQILTRFGENRMARFQGVGNSQHVHLGAQPPPTWNIRTRDGKGGSFSSLR